MTSLSRWQYVKRFMSYALLFVAALGGIGVLSNLVSADDVEKRVQSDCEESIAQVARPWRLPVNGMRRLPPSEVPPQKGTTAKGERVVFQAPPSAKPPFYYVSVAHAAPFILRVRYGWAASGSRMAFGQGGEQLVLSVFGVTKTLRDRIEWHY
jgi:hypothetical protein